MTETGLLDPDPRWYHFTDNGRDCYRFFAPHPRTRRRMQLGVIVEMRESDPTTRVMAIDWTTPTHDRAFFGNPDEAKAWIEERVANGL